MKKTITTLAILAIATIGKAQTDSLSMEKKTHELQEVVVKSDVARTTAEKSIYLPTRKHRNAATDATSLLQHMMIPQLSIDPMSQAVKTIANEEVTIFIDYLPATTQDLQGMNTQDVKRVEVLDFPTDARFQGKEHVVHFIMQKYEIGGYTKLTSTETVLNDFSADNSVYSKLSHKNWTFDANVTSNISNQSHLGKESTETFYLPSETVTRTETSGGGEKKNRQTSVSLRATYANKKMQLSNRLEFLDNNTPTQDLLGSVRYSPTVANSLSSVSRQDKRELTPTFNGNWYFFLPKQWTLSVNPMFQYSRNEENRFFQEINTIENFITEDVTRFSWSAVLRKTFGKKHTLGLVNSGLYYNSEVDYTGTTESTSKLTTMMTIPGVLYQFRLPKIFLSSYLSFVMEEYKVNGAKENVVYPNITFQAKYSPAKQHSLVANVKLTQGGATGSLRNPSVMQDNELLFYCGNPDIKKMMMNNADIQYTWLPSNKFSASVMLGQIYNQDYFTSIYRLTDDGRGVLRIFTNSDEYCQTQLSGNFTLRLLDNKLMLNVAPTFNHYETTGEYSHLRNTFHIASTATFYAGQFYLQGYYCSPKKYFSTQVNAWHDERPTYSLTAGWGNAAWKAKFEFINPFRTDWRGLNMKIDTPLYTIDSQALNASRHQSLKLTLSYTFNYGKKVRQGNELGTASGGQSSIL